MDKLSSVGALRGGRETTKRVLQAARPEGRDRPAGGDISLPYSPGLDGLRWMPAGDRALVAELRQQAPGTVLVEAVGGAYSDYGRLSSASGVPAFLGWAMLSVK